MYMDTRQLMRELKSSRTAFTPHIVAIYLLTAAGIAIDMWMPFLAASILDNVVLGGQLSLLNGYLWRMAICAIGGPLLSGLTDIMKASASQGMLMTLRDRFFSLFLRLPPDVVARYGQGKILNRYIHDVEQINASMVELPLDIAAQIGYGLASISMVAWFDWRVALVAVVLAPPLALLVIRLSQKSRITQGALSDAKAGLSQCASSTLNALRLIRQLNKQTVMTARFTSESADTANAGIRSEYVTTTYQPLIDFTCNLVVGGMTTVGALLILRGQLTVGEMTSAGWYIWMFVCPVMGIGAIVRGYAAHRASLARVAPLIETTKADEGAVSLTSGQGALTFDHLCAGYDRMTVHGVSLSIPAGQTVQIVGAPGSGKSTLALAIGRMVRTEGTLKIDGIPHTDLTLESLRTNVSYAFSDPFVFTGTLRENIVFGRPNASDADVARVIDICQLSEFVASRADGLNAPIQQNQISGGQRARICLARALLTNAPVLVLDSVTSALDSDTAEKVLTGVLAYRKGKTTLIIAVSPLPESAADLVLVMDGGTALEYGTYGDLLAQDGRFRKMVLAADDIIGEEVIA